MDDFPNLLNGTMQILIGALFGAFFSWWFTKKANDTAMTLRLYDEWNSESMLATRHGIQEVREFFDRDEKNNLDSRYRSISPEQRASIWRLIYFYEKLYVMIEKNQCNRKIVPDLFGESFYWWYLNCFEAKLLPSEERSSSIRIRKLKNWLDKRSSPDELSRWKRREAATTKGDYKVVPDNSDLGKVAMAKRERKSKSAGK